MFAYTVMTEEQAMNERFQLLQEGEYEAVVAMSEDKQSKSGNPMMEITLDVYDKDGKKHAVRDYLVFMPSMMWKVVQFADSSNLLQEYMQEKLCSEVARDRALRVKIGIEAGKLIPEDKLNGKPQGSTYPAKNTVVEYVKLKDQKPMAGEKIEDSDIPF